MTCPSDDQLSDYLSGALDAAVQAQIGTHLDGCEDCRQLVIAAVRAGQSQALGSDELDDGALAMGSSPLHRAVKVGDGSPMQQGSDAARDASPRSEPAEGGGKSQSSPSAKTPTVGVGSRLGRYVLTELLGVGGMGQVFRARDQELDRDVALKVLRPGLSGSAEMLTARLLRESRLMARLSHPSVVAVYDVGRQGSLVFVAMELIDGSTLSSWLRGRRTVEEILTAFAAAGRGLLAAHQAGLVHRDFKPDNVLVSRAEDGGLSRVVVTDLGVARAAIPSSSSLAPGSGRRPGSGPIDLATFDVAPPTPPPPGSAPPGAGAAGAAGAQSPAAGAAGSRRPRLTPPPFAMEPTPPYASPVPGGSAPRRSESSGRGLPLHDLQEGLTIPGATIGTPAYMAPEQLEGRIVDQRADVFAYAASLWEALWTSRPFPGRTIGEIAAAMGKPPVRGPARGRVPRKVERALEAALAIDCEKRTPSLEPLLAAIERASDPGRHKRRTWAIVIASATVVAVATTAVLVRHAQDDAFDPCGGELAQVEQAFAPAQLTALKNALGNDEAAGRAVTALAATADKWKATQRRLCTAHLAASPRLCLSARRTELLGVREDLLADPIVLRPSAERYVHQATDPTGCATPPPGLLFSRIPEDPALRQPVRVLRARLDAAEQDRERGEIESALVEMRRLRDAAEQLWQPLYAEVVYAEGATETQSGNSIRGVVKLKQAAAIAEKAHHDSIVAACWTQLVASAAFTDNDVERALEYATYADAALDRVGRPPADEALLLYYEGAALVQGERPQEGEIKLRQALELAKAHVPDKVPVVVQGLGFLYDHGGDHANAIKMYRMAIEMSKQPPGELAMYRAQLGRNLSMRGEREEALRVTTQAVKDATGYLDPKNDDWTSIDASYLLALRQMGRSADALAALPPAMERAKEISGERGAITAIFRQLEAVLLTDLGKVAQAQKIIGSTCEALAFTAKDTSIDYAGCLSDQAWIELTAGKTADALRHADEAITIVEGAFRATSDVALVYQVRGEAARRLGDLRRAAADFDKAVAICASSSADPAFLASAHIWRSRLTAMTDPAAAAEQLRQSIAVLAPAPGLWGNDLKEAEAMLARIAPKTTAKAAPKQ